MDRLGILCLVIIGLVYLVSADVETTEGKKNSGGEPCRCKDRASRRLRRKINDIKFNQCNDYWGSRTIEIHNVTVTPEPLIAPGEMSVGMTLKINNFLPQDIQVEMTVYKYMFNIPFRVYCTPVGEDLRFGSCLYDNVCQAIETTACSALTANNLPCNCMSILPGTYQLDRAIPFMIPNLNSMFDVLVKGDYKVRAEFINNRSKQAIGCLEAAWNISKIHNKKNKDKKHRRS